MGRFGLSIDEDMDKISVRRGFLIVTPKQADFVTNAGAANARNTEAGGNGLREVNSLPEPTSAFDTKADDLALPRIETTLVHQKMGDRGVEEAVIIDVVDMAIDVVVHPARGQVKKHLKGAARRRLVLMHVPYAQAS